MDKLLWACFAVLLLCLFECGESISSASIFLKKLAALEKRNYISLDDSEIDLPARQTDEVPVCAHRESLSCWSCENIERDSPEKCKTTGSWQKCTGNQNYCAVTVKSGSVGDQQEYYFDRGCSDACTPDCKTNGIFPCTASCLFTDDTYYGGYKCTENNIMEYHVHARQSDDTQGSPVVTPATQCSNVVNATRGLVTSPNFPGNYPSKLNCTTVVDVGHRIIEATFVNFSIEFQEKCQYDYVQLYEVYGDNRRDLLGGQVCGTKLDLPKLTVSAYYMMEVHFVSDFSQESTGFKLEYETYPLTKGGCLFGAGACAFQCHCFPGDYSGCDAITGTCPNDQCLYVAPNTTHIGEEWKDIPGTDVTCQEGNVALGMQAFSHSPTNHEAYKGVDGLLGSCTRILMDLKSESAWWMVDLAAKHRISKVQIYNSAKNNESTLGYFFLKHGNISYVELHYGCNMYTNLSAIGTVVELTCPVVARYVSLLKYAAPKINELQFDEIKVIGHRFYDVDCGNCGTRCVEGVYCEQCKLGFALPDCKRQVLNNCGAPQRVENGQVHFDLTVVGSSLMVNCSSGYGIVGDSTVVCGMNGLWGTMPKCQQVTCTTPPKLDDGNANVSGFMFGDAVTYGCSEGYMMKGDVTLVCSVNGTWTGTMPQCEIIDCGSPRVNNITVENGVLNYTISSFGAEAMVTCDSGYVLNGGKFQCGSKGTWEIVGSRPMCQKIGCGEAPAFRDGTIVKTGTEFQSTAVYTCNSGFTFDKTDSTEVVLSCTGSGKWNTTAPFCEQNCGGQRLAGKGLLTSPQYPNPYNNNRDCRWLLYTDQPGKTITISFTDFSIELYANCEYDSLNIKEIFGSRYHEIGTFCGNVKPEDINSMGQAVEIKFTSDGGTNEKGFSAGYAGFPADPNLSYENLIKTFYPEFSDHIFKVDIVALSEAVTGITSQIIAREGLYDTIDCLHLYEIVGGISHVVIVHSYPRIERYFNDLLHHMVIHSPLTDANSEALASLMAHENYTQMFDSLVVPLYDLAESVSELFGLRYYEYPPVVGIFRDIMDMLTNQSNAEAPSWQVVADLAEYKHTLLMEALIETNITHHCDPSISQHILALIEEAVIGLKAGLDNFPDTVRTSLGRGAGEELAALLLSEVVEHIDILEHPYKVLVDTLDIMKEQKQFGMQSLIPNHPKYEQLLQYTYASILKISKDKYILRDVVDHVEAKSTLVQFKEAHEITQVELYQMISDMLSYVAEKSYVTCMKTKLAAMVSGLLEVKLYDIVMVDLNVSTIVMNAVRHLNISDASRREEVYDEMHHDFRSVLFSAYRTELLAFDGKLERVTGGAIMAETFPLDLLFAIQYLIPLEPSRIMYGLVETALPLLSENQTCPPQEIIGAVAREIREFISSFNDSKLMPIVDNMMQSLSFYNQIDGTTKDLVKHTLTEGLKGIMHKILKDISSLNFTGDSRRDWEMLMDFIANGSAKIMYNHFQWSKPKPEVDSDVLVQVIELQHQTLKQIVTHYMQTLKYILKTAGNDVCESYPHICELQLNVSLSMDDENIPSDGTGK